MDVVGILEIGLVAVLTATVMTVPLFLLVLTITGLGRRWLAPWARQMLWSLVLLRLLLPASAASPLSLQPAALWIYGRAGSLLESSDTEHSANIVDAVDESVTPYRAAGQEMRFSAISSVPPAPKFDWLAFLLAGVLPCALVFGTLLVAIWTAVTTIRLSRWVRAGAACQREDWLAVLTEGRRLFGITRAVSLRTVLRLSSPATCGTWRPTILLPEDASTWSTTELRHVLWHELAHIRRHDVATNWLLAVVRSLHWWNPMFWWAQRAWLAERELACDALVLSRLGSSESSEYGRTLVRSLERLSAADRGLPSSATPGFVLFLGRKRAMVRRLQQLPQLMRPERAWRRWLVGGLIATLGIAGLTDAVARPRHVHLVTSIELPSGTTWRIAMIDEPNSEAPRTDRAYDLSAVIAQELQADLELTPHAAGLGLQQTLQAVLRPNMGQVQQKSSGTPQTPDENPAVSSCRVEGDQLKVHATAAQHDEIRRLLTRWSKHGLRQICLESMLISTPLSLKDLLPGSGGYVLNLGSGNEDPPFDQGLNGQTAQAWTQHHVPAFIQILAPREAQALASRLQSDARSNLMHAPKLTMFDALSASIQSGSQRPFVTGLKSRDEGGYEPQLSIVSEGILLQLSPAIVEDGEATQLQVQYQQSKILDVEVLEIPTSGLPAGVQIPHVSRSVVVVTSTIPKGHSLLVAPLRRDQQGQLQLCLIRPTTLP